MYNKQRRKIFLFLLIVLLIIIIFYDTLYPLNPVQISRSSIQNPLYNFLFHLNSLLNTINIWANDYIFSSSYYLLSISLYHFFSTIKLRFKRIFFPVLYFGLLVTILDQMLQYAFTPPEWIFPQILTEHFSFIIGFLQCYLVDRYRKFCRGMKRKMKGKKKRKKKRVRKKSPHY